MKECNKCSILKPLTEFHKSSSFKDGHKNCCKICRNLMSIEYRKSENYKKVSDEYFNSDRYKKYREEYTNSLKYKIYKSNADKKRYLENRDRKLIYQKNYQKSNKNKINLYYRNRRYTDINYKIKCNLRTRLNKAMKNNWKSGSAIKDLGCSIEQLKFYLQNKFQPGMSWDNYGQWHIDHIKALANFDLKNKNQFLKASHYTNLQPLWAKDNIVKGAN